jgi:hypothetical protein
MSLQKAIEKEFKKMKDKGWDKIFWMVDFHDTIMPGSYKKDDGDSEFYPDAVEVLQALTKRNDIAIILWTSSYKDYLEKHITRMKDLGIEFDYFNENPYCKSDALCDFSGKFYFNIVLEDKAGFDGMEDWGTIKEILKEYPEGYQKK